MQKKKICIIKEGKKKFIWSYHYQVIKNKVNAEKWEKKANCAADIKRWWNILEWKNILNTIGKSKVYMFEKSVFLRMIAAIEVGKPIYT